jgi:hypothetical protein
MPLMRLIAENIGPFEKLDVDFWVRDIKVTESL